MTVLDQILARTRRQVERQRRRCDPRPTPQPARGERARRALKRDGGRPNVIAEVKFRSPSAGMIRKRGTGASVRVARQYVKGGAAAVSVLADGPGFGGSVADVRRVSHALEEHPVLFKGFVLDPLQVRIAASAGASMVLLLVAALRDEELSALVDLAQSLGLEPVVEAATSAELARALATSARIIGINARDLHTFEVDPARAEKCLEAIPSDRLAVYMSGVRSKDDLVRLAQGRADAALVGEGLMRHAHPELVLAEWLK